MPDEHGNIRGIRVPRVPWHEIKVCESEPRDIHPDDFNGHVKVEFNDVELDHDPYGIGNPD